ncbi:MAG TPA: DUF429 domain-containing protein [Armatimonadota bacterium]|nr:DUF429 domain-containing protein [Armatimonadota bacterium]
MATRVCGIDWATQPSARAAVILEDGEAEGELAVGEIISPLTDERVRELCTSSDYQVVGVDTPFGWPAAFTQFVSGWTPTGPRTGEVPALCLFQYRLTDRIVCKEPQKRPLSVSSNLIGLSARAWVDFVTQWGLSRQIDVGAGDPEGMPRLIEVYPGATLAALFPAGGELKTDRYKNDEEVRARVVDGLLRTFHIHCDEQQRRKLISHRSDSDNTDALLAALTCWCYLGKLDSWSARRPKDAEQDAARQEGWIFFPTRR